MKAKLVHLVILFAIVFAMNSCSTDSSETPLPEASSKKNIIYTQSVLELEAMNLINIYRVSIGLKALESINYISYKSEQHNNYMIINNVVSHDDFVSRSEDIIKVLGAKKVGENIAYNYNSPQAALIAWLNSPQHKKNIEGDFTNFGISISKSSSGKIYYTNIFVKI